MEPDKHQIVIDHIWDLRKGIEDRMNKITDIYKQSYLIYHELSDLVYEYEEIFGTREYQETINDGR